MHTSTFQFATDNEPSLPELLNFRCRDEKIDILEQIVDYRTFGTFLLDDKTGTIISSIERARMHRSHEINEEIFITWKAGSGLKPVTWNTLVECLRNAKLHTLADKIEAVLQ